MEYETNGKIKGIEYIVLKYLIIFYPILISLGRFIPFIETILTLIMLGILVLDCITKKKLYIKYIIIAIFFIISSQMDIDKTNHIDHIKVLLIFFLTIDCYYNGLYEKISLYIEKNYKFILAQILIILMINFIFMFLSLGYSNGYSADWGLNAFQGIFTDPHQAAYRLCSLLVIVLIISKYDKKTRLLQYLLVFGIEYCILETGARVPTALGLAIGVSFLIRNKIKIVGYTEIANRFFSYLPLIIFGIFALYFCIFHTSFGAKILNTSRGSSFDSGRSNLREMDIQNFKQFDTFHKLFGNGTDNTIKSHATQYSGAIWSHNDFFQILCGMGLLMEIIYLFQWLKLLLKMLKSKKFLGFMSVVACIVVAFFNGLYIHSRFVFIMPILFVYFINSTENKRTSNREEGKIWRRF